MAGLAQMVNDILDGVITLIEDAGMDAVRGDKARPLPKRPAVWVVAEPAICTSGYGEEEEWQMPVSLAGLAQAQNPEEGAAASVELAANARRAIVLAPRDLGVEGVIDTTSTQFNATARTSERNRTLFWAEAQVMVRFEVREEEES